MLLASRESNSWNAAAGKASMAQHTWRRAEQMEHWYASSGFRSTAG
jgi:hypothetical protein